jgi:hypothetical protein
MLNVLCFLFGLACQGTMLPPSVVRPLPDVNRNNTTIVMPKRIIPGKISSDSSNR